MADPFTAFLEYSKEIGSDPSLVQAAGGNTSVKIDDVMWVKASGTWLANATSEDIMVPMDFVAIVRALENPACTEEDIRNCVDRSLSKTALRPSIEAPIHAVLAHKYVIHTHDLETLASAVQVGSHAFFETALKGLNWKYVPYIKPGLDLGRQIQSIKSDTDNVFILENHGLVICGDDLEGIKALTQDVRARICHNRQAPTGGVTRPEFKTNIELAGTGFHFCKVAKGPRLACHAPWMDKLGAGAFTPDIMVFLGPKITTLDHNDPNLTAKLAQLSNAPLPLNSCVILKNHGLLVRDDALNGANEMVECVYDLLRRIPDEATLRYFSADEQSTLMNWDAEKYRQQLYATDNVLNDGS